MGHTADVTAVTFSPDGSRVISGSNEDKTIRVWDWIDGKLLNTYFLDYLSDDGCEKFHLFQSNDALRLCFPVNTGNIQHLQIVNGSFVDDFELGNCHDVCWFCCPCW